MNTYKIKFTNTLEFFLTASSRKMALNKAIQTTRGLFSDLTQRNNLTYCKLLKEPTNEKKIN